MHGTLLECIESVCEKHAARVWLRDRKGDEFTEWIAGYFNFIFFAKLLFWIYGSQLSFPGIRSKT